MDQEVRQKLIAGYKFCLNCGALRKTLLRLHRADPLDLELHCIRCHLSLFHPEHIPSMLPLVFVRREST